MVGVALAGGRSSRMGRDKGAIRLRRGTLLEWTLERLRAVCPEVVVASGQQPYTAGATSVQDGPGRGPAAGILGAAAARVHRPLLVLACDLPNVPEGLLSQLLTTAEPDSGWDWSLPRLRGAGRRSRVEPLCALYTPRALETLRLQVTAGRYSLQSLAQADGLRIRYLEEDELARYGDPQRLFLNLNTPRDLEQAREER